MKERSEHSAGGLNTDKKVTLPKGFPMSLARSMVVFTLVLASCDAPDNPSAQTQETKPRVTQPSDYVVTPDNKTPLAINATRIAGTPVVASPWATQAPDFVVSATPTADFISQAALIDEFDLPQERTYTDVGNYLVDNFGIKHLKFENQNWTIVPDAEMYEVFLEAPHDYPYLGWDERIDFIGLGDDFHLADPGYLYYRIMPVWTGNWKETLWHDPESDKDIADIALETVLQDANGKVRKLYFSIGSPDLNGLAVLGYQIKTPDGGKNPPNFYGTQYELIEELEPGQQLKFDFHTKKPEGGTIKEECYPNGWCSDQYNAAHYQFLEREEDINRLVDELVKGDDYTDFSDLVIPYYSVGIYTKEK